VNRPLGAGLILLALLALLAAASGKIAPHEQGYSRSISIAVVDGRETMVTAPEPPGRNFVLGSDPWGRDLFSEMLHGLPWTLAIVLASSLARCAGGLAAGLALALGRARAGRSPSSRGFSPLSAIPGFIVAAFILYPVTINSRLPAPYLFLIQAAVLVLVESAPVAASFAAKAAVILKRPFVEAARVGGAGPAWLLSRHLLPFLAFDFLEALPVQAVSVASMIGKLGIVKLFIGGTNKNYDPVILSSVHSEWLGLLGNYYDAMFTRPWLFLAPFAGWMLVLASAILVSSGLKKSFAKARRIDGLE
jgi:peptide/nickel transport system permease protein